MALDPLTFWLAASAAVAWSLRHRPVLAVCLAVALWSVVPALAAQHLVGHSSGFLGSHPSTWLVFAIAAAAMLSHPRRMVDALLERPLTMLAIVTFLVVAVVTTYLGSRTGLRLFFDQMLAPTVLFWVVVAFAPTDRLAVRALRGTVIGAVCLQCAFAVVEWVRGDLLFYKTDYLKLPWYNPDRFDRWLGTTDSPLLLALIIGIAAPLTVGVRNSALRLLLLSLQLVGALITQSRVVLGALALVLVYLFLRGGMTALGRLVTAAIVVVGGALVARSTLTDGVAQRLADDTGSAAARSDAVKYFVEQLDRFAFTGDGLLSNYGEAREAGLGTSLESSFLMYAVDVGVVAAALYFGAMLAIVLRNGRRNTIAGAPVAALIGIAMTQTFSALAYSNLAGTYLWAVLALVVAGSTRRSSSVPVSEESPRTAALPPVAAVGHP